MLVEALEQAEAAGSSLENALEKIAGMDPGLVLDEDTLLGASTEHLQRLRQAERRTV